MKIGVPKERRPHELRVAASPDTVKRLTGDGVEVLVEKGAGAGALMPDEAFAAAGAQIVERPEALYEAADLVRYKADWLYEQGLPCGPEANMAKLLAADASWAAANACLDTHGGFGFAEEYDVERKFRETRLYQVAPVSTNLILAYLGQHVLGMPRSY